MRSIAKIFVLLLLLAHSGFAKTTARQNSVSNDVRQPDACNSSSLTTTQKAKIANLKREQNLWECLTGSIFCNPAPLDPSQRAAGFQLKPGTKPAQLLAR